MKTAKIPSSLEPFPNCPALDGCHCITNSLAKLLGLGAGMGFIYWQMKMGAGTYIFVGGRANTKDFYKDLGSRTGVGIREICTSSAKKAEAELIEALARKEPVMLGGDMGFLPWFHFPQEYHFGGHAFVVCGFEEGILCAGNSGAARQGQKLALQAFSAKESAPGVRLCRFSQSGQGGDCRIRCANCRCQPQPPNQELRRSGAAPHGKAVIAVAGDLQGF